MGVFREFATAGGGGPVRLGKVLMCSVTSVVTVWVRDLGADVSNVKKKLEGVHMGLLQQVVGNKTHWLGGDSWQKVAAESVLQVAGKKSLKT